MRIILYFIIFLYAFCIIEVYTLQEEFLHQRPDQQKSSPGWQEPGLWRPKWIMDREFTSAEPSESKTVTRDRLYFRLKSDRTVKIYSQKSRPFIEWRKKTPKDEEKKKRLFEETDGTSSKEDEPNAEEVKSKQIKAFKTDQEALYDADGAWWWAEDVPPTTAKVKIETREGEKGERIRHETRCEWGKLDGYAAKFRKGVIMKYKGVNSVNGLPLGSYQAGTFIIRPTVHRPLVGKDFQAFQ